MDFSKYVDLLTTGQLHFARADRLEDPYDCSAMQFLGESYKDMSLAHPQIRERTCQVNTSWRLFVYVNCWHMNDVQSAALWRLYSENKDETIAIQSTFGRLASELKGKWPRDGILISQIRYNPDNAGESVPGARLFSCSGWESIVYKRPSFAHERELRAFIFQRYDRTREEPLRNGAHLKALKETRPEYIRIDVTPSDLIEKVYVSPYANDVFLELVKKMPGGLKDRVLKSDLYELY